MATEQTMLLRIGGVSMSKRGGRSPANLRMAAAHNLRANQDERGARVHIDPSRSGLNQILRGPDTPAMVVARATTKMAQADINTDKLRKDYTQAIELVASLPHESDVDNERFFDSVADWADARYGPENVLSVVVHYDEAAPHCHVLVLPLLDGKMQGAAMKAMQAVKETTADFFRRVAEQFGLQRQKRSASPVYRMELARAVLERLSTTSDPVMRSACWGAIRSQIEQNPRPMAEALALSITTKERTKPMRTLAQIMTSTGRKTSEDREVQKAIAIESTATTSKAIALDIQKAPKAMLCSFRPNPRPQMANISRPVHQNAAVEQAGVSASEPEPISSMDNLWSRVGSRVPTWQVTGASKHHPGQLRSIESLAELWNKVGCNVAHTPQPHQDRHQPVKRFERAHSDQEQNHGNTGAYGAGSARGGQVSHLECHSPSPR